jgi:predicted small integral membrane protein
MNSKINVYRVLMGKSEGKTPLKRFKHRWEDNIKMDLRQIGWCVVDWINLAQDRNQWWALVNTVINLRDSLHFGNFFSS